MVTFTEFSGSVAASATVRCIGFCNVLCKAQGEVAFSVGLCSCTPRMSISWKINKHEIPTYQHTSNYFPELFYFCQLFDKQIMTNAKCYFPDGSIATGDTPCNSAATSNSVSACCGYSDICLDNALCLMQHKLLRIVRGSCTDETWQSPQCAQYCSDGNCHLFSIAPDLVKMSYAISLVSSC